jgi:hypothetical protein
MTHIDISRVLRQTLACDLYSNLVTRPTGAAVRGQIEHLLEDDSTDAGRALTVIDFSQVSMIDFSCADEVVAKLLLRYAGDSEAQGGSREVYFLFRGLHEDHWDAIDAVLERHGLALATERCDGCGIEVVGVLSDEERLTWETVYRLGQPTFDDLSASVDLGPDSLRAALSALCTRRLIMSTAGRYTAVGRGNWIE